MELWLMWVVAGFVLVIAELVTGTFYLLVVGLGAFVGGVVAYLGGNEVVQVVVGAVVSTIGAFFVYRWHSRQRAPDRGHANLLERGQPVVLEGLVDEGARIARVRYRGAWWDARLTRPDEHPSPGSTLYIESLDGSTLLVASAPPR